MGRNTRRASNGDFASQESGIIGIRSACAGRSRRSALRISRTVCSELRLLGLRFVTIVPLRVNGESKVSLEQSGQCVRMVLTGYIFHKPVGVGEYSLLSAVMLTGRRNT